MEVNIMLKRLKSLLEIPEFCSKFIEYLNIFVENEFYSLLDGKMRPQNVKLLGIVNCSLSLSESKRFASHELLVTSQSLVVTQEAPKGVLRKARLNTFFYYKPKASRISTLGLKLSLKISISKTYTYI